MGARRMLSIHDRVEIRAGKVAGWGVRKIAAAIGRQPSVVSRELERNSLKGGYKPVAADVLAERRRARPKPRAVSVDEVLRARVVHDLAAKKSPKAIAGRLQEERHDPLLVPPGGAPRVQGRCVSHEAIYQFVYAHPVGELKRRRGDGGVEAVFAQA